MDSIRTARIIATIAHKGQVDKGGNPYIEHPKFVADSVSGKLPKTVAWLHDVVEDTNVTLNDLLELGIPRKAVDAVDCITKRDGELYDCYLDRVASNKIATIVKLADLRHNSNIWRIPNPTERDYEKRKKYLSSIERLEEVMKIKYGKDNI